MHSKRVSEPQIDRKIHSTYTTYFCKVKRYSAENKSGLIFEGGISEADFEKMKGDFEVNGHEDKERTEQNMIKIFETFYDLHRVTEILSSLGH